MISKEVKFGIKNFKTYQDFGNKIDKIKFNVIGNIKKLKQEHEQIIAYGAPAKATTALNYFNISKEIDFIVEDNKLKHGKFVPGVKIPIVSKNKLKISNSTILVLKV